MLEGALSMFIKKKWRSETWATRAELPADSPKHKYVNYDGSSTEALHKAASVPHAYFH